jgi:RsiW-degrading membrane proteinase PrsW (M82 family)
MYNQGYFQIERHEPGIREKISFLLSGLVISVPISLFLETMAKDYLRSILPPGLASFLLITVMAPVIEEYSKIYPLFHRHAETEKNIMNLAFLIGLGFGISEFFIYVFGLGAPVYIRVPAILFHATNASITAYGVAKNNATKYYSFAVGLHFLNNFFAEFGELWFLGGVGATLFSYYYAWRLYQRVSDIEYN